MAIRTKAILSKNDIPTYTRAEREVIGCLEQPLETIYETRDLHPLDEFPGFRVRRMPDQLIVRRNRHSLAQ